MKCKHHWKKLEDFSNENSRYHSSFYFQCTKCRLYKAICIFSNNYPSEKYRGKTQTVYMTREGDGAYTRVRTILVETKV